MEIRSYQVYSNALNTTIARQLRSGPQANRPQGLAGTLNNSPQPKDAIVLLTEEAKRFSRKGLPVK